MGGNDRDNRPRSDRQYREGLMTGLLIALANQVGQGWSTAIIIATPVLLGLSLRRAADSSAEQPEPLTGSGPSSSLKPCGVKSSGMPTLGYG